MTHPLQIARAPAARRKAQKGEPFDPEELSRLLNKHLEDQQLRTERRREAKAVAKAAALVQQQQVYLPYVPLVAAAAFERTTTTDGVRKHSVNKHAQSAFKSHLDHLSREAQLSGHLVTNLQRTQAMDQAALEKEMLRNRNQFQWDHEMEEAAIADLERDLYKLPRRSFNAEFAHLQARSKRRASRPLSTGDVFGEAEESKKPAKLRLPLKPIFDGNDRHDWAQRDEAEPRKKGRTSPLLRKMESRWILLVKKEKVPVINDVGGLITEGQKVNLMARFKRPAGRPDRRMS